MARPRRKRLALSKRSKLTSNSRSLPHHDSEEDSELSSTDSSSVHGGTEITGLSETDPDSGNDSGENDNEEDEGDGADITDGLNGSRTMASANNDEDYDQDEEAEVRPPASTAIMVPDEEWYKNNPKRTPGNYHYPKEMILHGLQITEQQLHKFHIKAASILKEDPNAQANYVTAEETIMRRLPRSFRKVAYQNQWAHSAIQKWLRHTVKRILNPRFFRPMGSKTKNGSGTKAVANSRKRRRTQSPALSEQIPGTRRSRGARPQTSPGNHQTRNRERHSRAHTEQPQVAPPVNSSRVARQNVRNSRHENDPSIIQPGRARADDEQNSARDSNDSEGEEEEEEEEEIERMRRQNSQTAWHDSMPDVTGLSSPMLLTDVEDNPGIGLPLELPPIVEDITEPNIDAGETAKRSATAPVQCRSLAISSKDTSEYNITAQFQVLKNLGDTIASRAKEHLDFSNSHLATYITKKADLATLNISLRAKTSELEQLPTVDGLLTEGDMFANKSASVSLFSQYAKEMGDLLQKMRQTTRVEEKSLNHRINTLKVELSDCQTNLKLAGTFALQSVDDARREISELEASACAAEKLVEHFRKNARVNRDRLMALEVTPELAEAKAATSET